MHESLDVAWIDPARLAELDVHPAMRLRIDHALQGNTAPYIV
jgi:hypothetical protein